MEKEHGIFKLLSSSGVYLLKFRKFQKLDVCVRICLNTNRNFSSKHLTPAARAVGNILLLMRFKIKL